MCRNTALARGLSAIFGLASAICLVRHGPVSTIIGPNSSTIRPMLAHVGPKSAKLAPNSGLLGPTLGGLSNPECQPIARVAWPWTTWDRQRCGWGFANRLPALFLGRNRGALMFVCHVYSEVWLVHLHECGVFCRYHGPSPSCLVLLVFVLVLALLCCPASALLELYL